MSKKCSRVCSGVGAGRTAHAYVYLSTTWSHDDKPEHFWPETASIMIWGYHASSNPFSAGTTMSISRFATDLLNALVVNYVGPVSNHFVSLQDPLTVILNDTSDCLCALHRHSGGVSA